MRKKVQRCILLLAVVFVFTTMAMSTLAFNVLSHSNTNTSTKASSSVTSGDCHGFFYQVTSCRNRGGYLPVTNPVGEYGYVISSLKSGALSATNSTQVPNSNYIMKHSSHTCSGICCYDWCNQSWALNSWH